MTAIGASLDAYEPFLCKQSVKVSAAVPINWKLNHRLFHKAFRKFLEPSHWIFHADGGLPYYPWWINCPLKFSVWFYRKIGIRFGVIRGNQGPWGDWNRDMKSEKWFGAIKEYSMGAEPIRPITTSDDISSFLERGNLPKMIQINLLQTLYFP